MMERKTFFGHENLDVYRVSLEYFTWSFKLCERLKGPLRHSKDQLYRASQSIILNIAEGNGKSGDLDRKRFFVIARGSTLECAAIQDVLEIVKVISQDENDFGKEILSRIVAMLTGLKRKK